MIQTMYTCIYCRSDLLTNRLTFTRVLIFYNLKDSSSPHATHPQEVFLPQGYPDSVSDDYLSYQLWDTLQVGS